MPLKHRVSHSLTSISVVDPFCQKCLNLIQYPHPCTSDSNEKSNYYSRVFILNGKRPVGTTPPLTTSHSDDSNSQPWQLAVGRRSLRWDSACCRAVIVRRWNIFGWEMYRRKWSPKWSCSKEHRLCRNCTEGVVLHVTNITPWNNDCVFYILLSLFLMISLVFPKVHHYKLCLGQFLPLPFTFSKET